MSIANVGAFVKGAATGHRDALDERRKEEDQQFQQEQRGRQKKEWATADAVQSQLAGIQRPGKYAEVGPSIDGMGPTRSGFEVSPQDYQRQVADVYASHGMLDKSVAAEDRSFTLGQQARTLREQDVNDAVLQAGRLRLTDPIGAMRVLTKASRGVVPGFDFEETVDPVTGATLVGYKNTRTGEWLEKPQPVNAETVQLAIDETFKWASTQNWAKSTELGIRKQDADTNAQYRKDSAENMREQRRLQEMGLQQQAAYQQGQLAISRMNAANAASRTGGSKQLPQEMVVQLNEAAAAVDNARTPQERQAAQQRYMNLYSNAATVMGKVLKPGEVKGSFSGVNSMETDPTRVRYEAVRQGIMGNKDLEPLQKMEQLRELDAAERFEVVQRQVPMLAPEERVPELRRLIQTGQFDREQIMKMGFTLSELRAADQGQRESASGAVAGTQPNTQPFPPLQQDAGARALSGIIRNMNTPAQAPVDVRNLKPQGTAPYGVKPW